MDGLCSASNPHENLRIWQGDSCSISPWWLRISPPPTPQPHGPANYLTWKWFRQVKTESPDDQKIPISEDASTPNSTIPRNVIDVKPRGGKNDSLFTSIYVPVFLCAIYPIWNEQEMPEEQELSITSSFRLTQKLGCLPRNAHWTNWTFEIRTMLLRGNPLCDQMGLRKWNV